MDETRWDVFFQLGMQAYQAGDFDQARQAFEVCVEEAAQLDPPDLRLARGLNNLACALSRLGHFQQSIAIQQQGLMVSRKLLGDDHEVVAAGLLNLASDYGKLERYGEAEALYASVLQRQCSDEVRLQALENLSQFHMARQKLPEAAETLRQMARVLGGQPDRMARCLHSLANVYDALGEDLSADAARSQSLQLIEELWGKHNMAYGEVVANMAESLMAQQRLAKAAELYGQAAEALQGCVPADDARLAGCRLGRLIALRDSGQLEEAARWGAASPDHSRRWLNEYGLVFFLQKRFEEAADRFRQSLELPEELPMPARISVLFNLGSALMGAGQYPESLAILENIAGLAEEHLGGEHAMTGRIWVQLRELYRLTEKPDGERSISEKLARHGAL